MAVPENIRKVPRPKNSIVVDRGVEGMHRYAVRERAGVKYNAQGKSMPINGPVIGYIFNGSFIRRPVPVKKAASVPQELSYGAAAFVYSEVNDLFTDLCNVYELSDAASIVTIAMLRCIKPHIKNRRLGTEYHRSFVSHYFPGIHLSTNTVGTLFRRLGEGTDKRQSFYHLRMSKVEASHHVIIDGMLKQNTSSVNDLSEHSHKAHIRGCKDVSVLYAYDLEKMEPICAEVFPGNMPDITSFSSFVDHCGIDKGIIIADKGFSPKEVRKKLETRPQLHYLIPLKRNDKRIRTHQMLEFQGVLTGIDQQVSYCKKRLKSGLFLYAYKEHDLANAERHSFIEKMKQDASISQQQLKDKEPNFGTIVFESDQDLDSLTAYLSYEDRWQIEMVFDAYKNDEFLNCTNVQDDFALRGSEFVNFISTVLTCRLRRRAQRTGLLKKLSFRDLLEDLGTAWRKVNGTLPPTSFDEHWIADYKGVFTLLETLGLSKRAENSKPQPNVTAQGVAIPGKPGRPRVRPILVGPKRPRGRPRKLP